MKEKSVNKSHKTGSIRRLWFEALLRGTSRNMTHNQDFHGPPETKGPNGNIDLQPNTSVDGEGRRPCDNIRGAEGLTYSLSPTPKCETSITDGINDQGSTIVEQLETEEHDDRESDAEGLPASGSICR